MVDGSQIKEHMEIVGSDGQHVGTVDKVEGQKIKLTKSDSSSAHHQYVQMDMIASVKDGKAHLSKSAADAKKQMG